MIPGLFTKEAGAICKFALFELCFFFFLSKTINLKGFPSENSSVVKSCFLFKFIHIILEGWGLATFGLLTSQKFNKTGPIKAFRILDRTVCTPKTCYSTTKCFDNLKLYSFAFRNSHASNIFVNLCCRT